MLEKCHAGKKKRSAEWNLECKRSQFVGNSQGWTADQQKGKGAIVQRKIKLFISQISKLVFLIFKFFYVLSFFLFFLSRLPHFVCFSFFLFPPWTESNLQCPEWVVTGGTQGGSCPCCPPSLPPMLLSMLLSTPGKKQTKRKPRLSADP